MPGPKQKNAVLRREHPENGRRPVLAQMRNILDSLNSTERRIADCVLADPEKVIGTGIRAMRAQCGASTGSISVFCSRFGVKGFAEFKLALIRDLAQSSLPALETNGSLLESVVNYHTQCLLDTLQLNSQDVFEAAGKALLKARRIEIYSIGLSQPVAATAATKFKLLGLPANAQVDSHLQLITASQMKKGEIAIGVSCSGTTIETLDCLRTAKAAGATTICLTNAMNSPITACSDLSFYATPGQINYRQAPLASRVTQFAIIDALFVHLAKRLKNKTAERLQKSAEALRQRRYARGSTSVD